MTLQHCRTQITPNEQTRDKVMTGCHPSCLNEYGDMYGEELRCGIRHNKYKRHAVKKNKNLI